MYSVHDSSNLPSKLLSTKKSKQLSYQRTTLDFTLLSSTVGTLVLSALVAVSKWNGRFRGSNLKTIVTQNLVYLSWRLLLIKAKALAENKQQF